MKPKIYHGSSLLQIAMPMGGIGAGCICLNGHGGLQDFSIRHKPDLTATNDAHNFLPAAFATLRIGGNKPVTRLIEGPLPYEKVYDQGLQGQGYRKAGHEGMPRFDQAAFCGEYPFGYVLFADDEVPLEVQLTGWSPLVPLDAKVSGLPCAIMEYTLRNPTRKTVECELAYHLSHLAEGLGHEKGMRNSVIAGRGVQFTNTDPANEATFGSASLTVVGHKPVIKAAWLRAPAWSYEPITALWREVSEGRFRANDGCDKDQDGRNGGSVLVKLKLKPGEEAVVPFVITWYFPNVYDSPGAIKKPCDCEGKCEKTPAWQPWYSSQWKDAADVAEFVGTQYESLRARTAAFASALYSSTLPDAAMEAIGFNLAIIKSPTVLRTSQGNLWAWEGCGAAHGCCHGSCSHVWNYAQAIPHLFPELERTFREGELERSLDERGHLTFRAALPEGPTTHDFHAAADGQLGVILKFYRDWQISGDDDWLRRLYPLAKRALDYCISTWDPQSQGALSEPHHNTYDIEFWGPDGMCTSIYCGALEAMALMAEYLEQDSDVKTYRGLAQKSAAFMAKRLFNGEYFFQNVQWKQLQASGQFDKSLADTRASGNEELAQLLQREGPRYQYGKGCLSDGVIGAWMAKLYGVASPQDAALVRKHLKSIFKYNFRDDLFRHACLQRPGYAIGHEGGLILCTWPHGEKPTIPFIYSDEVWTGIEYQVASHMVAEGLVDEGTAIVTAARGRYDGHKRNPFNEYECGSYYARAMASYALLQAYSGFQYSAVTRTLRLDPKTARRPFRTFYSTASAFGVIEITSKHVRLSVTEGELDVEDLVLSGKTIAWDAHAGPGADAVLSLKTNASKKVK